MDAHELTAMRHEKDTFFRQSPHSPLSPEQQARFSGLRYYPPNEALEFAVTVQPFADQKRMQMQTSTGDVQTYVRYGEFTFEVEGQTARLTVYSGPNGFFLPFVDANGGGETYGAGRYLEPEKLGDSRFLVDFNQAYNPYCAYSSGWSCPIPPSENRISVAIRAGEMSPEGEWVEAE